MAKTRSAKQGLIQTIGRFFGLVVLIEIIFYLTPLEFLYSQYQFHFHILQVLIFAIYSVFLFKKRWQKIVYPLLISVAGTIAIAGIVLFLGFSCQNVKTHYYDLEEYLVSNGHRECLTGPQVGHYYQLEKRLLGNLITYSVHKKMVEYVDDISAPGNCIERFPDLDFEFNLCKARLESWKSYTR